MADNLVASERRIERSDGTPIGEVFFSGGLIKPLVFWQHDFAVTIPHATWTPIPWNVLRTTKGGLGAWAPDFGTFNPAAATEIAVGSNGQALPQATINVDDTSAFTARGYILIRIGGTDRVVSYTGKTATTFTGCTLGTGTMATDQVVRQGNVAWNPPSDATEMPNGCIVNAVTEVAWANAADGTKRGIRFRSIDGVFNFAAGTCVQGAVAGAGTASDPFHHMQTTEQPASVVGAGAWLQVEVIQIRGTPATLDSVLGEGTLDAPRLVAYEAAAIGSGTTGF